MKLPAYLLPDANEKRQIDGCLCHVDVAGRNRKMFNSHVEESKRPHEQDK